MAGNETFDLGLRTGKSTDVRSRLSDIANGAPLAGEPPKPRTVEDVALDTGVPWNVIEIVAQDAGIPEEQKIAFADDFAGRMREEMAKGQDVPGAMKAIFGNDAPVEDALDRAIGLAGGAVEGRAAAGQNNDNSMIEDAGRSVAGGVISGVGAIAEGVGTLLDVDDLFGDPGVTDWAQTAGKAVGETMRGWGMSVQDGMSDDAKKAVRNSTPKGKLFEPSTWEFEGDVSVEGIAMLTANVLGSLAPVVVAGIFTGGIGAAVVGGAQSAGAGAETAREIVNRATPEDLKANSALYNDLIAAGRSHEEAKAKVLDAAESLSAVFSAPVGALGGAFTGKLAQKGLAPLAGRGVGTRVAGTAAVGATEEGTQEVLEGVFARAGAELGSGLPVDKMEGTFGEAVLGALGGGVVGGARGALPSADADADGGDDDEIAPDQPAEPLPPDAGPMARAAQAAPKPAALPAPTAQSGQMVRVTPGDGQQVDAEYVGEDEAGIDVTVDGQPVRIARNDIEGGRTQVEPVDALSEAAWGDAEAKPDTSFAPIEDTTEPPAKRAERMTTALDAYLSEQKIDADDAMRAEVMNDIDRYGGSVQQAVGDLIEFMRANDVPENPPAPKIDPAREMAEADEAMRPGFTPSTQPGAGALRGPETNPKLPVDEPVTADSTVTAPEPGALPAPAAGDTPDARWDGMSPDNRAALLGQIGFRNSDGSLTAPGRRATTRTWGDLSERVREKLGERMAVTGRDGDAPVTPVTDPNRGLPQRGRADLVGERPEPQDPETGRTPRQQPGVNELPAGTDPITPEAPAPRGQRAPSPSASIENVRKRLRTARYKNANGERSGLVVTHNGDDVRVGGDTISSAEYDAINAGLDAEDARIQAKPASGTSQPKGPRVLVNVVGEDGKTDAERGRPLPKAPKTETKKDGKPFATVDAAWRALANRGKTLSDYQIEKEGAGFVAKPRTVKTEPTIDVRDPAEKTEAEQQAEFDAIDKAKAERKAKAENPTVGPLKEAGFEPDPNGGVLRLRDETANGRRTYIVRNPWNEAEGRWEFRLTRATQFDGGITAPPDKQLGAFTDAHAVLNAMRKDGWNEKVKLTVKPIYGGPERTIDTSHTTPAPNPTDAQKEAGNYKMGHVRWQGLDVSIETAKGQERSGTGPDGSTWSVTMPADYGYIRGTEGADGDHVDVYMGPDPDSDVVVIVDQMEIGSGKFDEHKVLIGFSDSQAAAEAYVAGFSDGRGADRVRGAVAVSVEQFKTMLGIEGAWQKPIAKEGAAREMFRRARGDRAAAEAFIEGKSPAEVEAAQKAGKGRPAEGINDVPGMAPKRPGYERLFVGGEPTTTQTRMTDDGFVIRREANRTQVIKPNGAILIQGKHDMPEREVVEAIKNARLETEPQWWSELTAAGRRQIIETAKEAGTFPKTKSDRTTWANMTAKDQRALTTAATQVSPGTGGSQAREGEPAAPPVADSRQEDKKRDARRAGRDAALRGDDRKAPEWMGEDLGGEWLVGYGEGIAQQMDAQRKSDATKRAAQKDRAAKDAAKPAYGASNTLVSKDRAAELRDRLKAKLAEQRNRTNAGIDPEILAIGAELAVFHIEAGARRFVGLARAIAGDLGTTPAELKPYLRSWYNGARDMMEDNGVSIDGMDDADTVRTILQSGSIDALSAAEMPQDTGNTDAELPSVNEGGDQEAPGDAGTRVRSDADEALEGAQPPAVQDLAEDGDVGAGSEPAGRPNRGAGQGDDGAGDVPSRGRGNRAGRSVSGAGKRRVKKPKATATPEPTRPQAPSVPAQDFIITDDLRLGQGGPAEKFADNVAAIETLKRIEAEQRRATPEEQAILARYVGWGGLKNAFRVAGSNEGEGVAKGWEGRVAQLETLLEPEELRAARNSTKAAHYTSETVVQGLWKIAERAGFAGGAVLEPSAGVGNFIGLMPEHLRGKSKVMAVEYDGITARIAKNLYPNAALFHSGFQNVPLPEGRFALAIGNPPFGRDSLYFQHLPSVNGKSIHHQFFEASMHALAPGGTLSMVVSRYLMDGKDNSNRVALARQGQLVGAIRLPSSAFQENARTEVITDILVFRKHDADPEVVQAAIAVATGAGKEPKLDDSQRAAAMEMADGFSKWLNVTDFADPGGSNETLAMNDYFLANKAMVLGDISATGTQHRQNELTVTLPAAEIEGRLDAAIQKMPEGSPASTVMERTREGFDRLAQAMGLSIRGAEPGAVRLDDDGRMMVVSEQMDGDTPILSEQELTADRPYTAEFFQGSDGKWRREVDALDDKGNKIKVKTDEGRVTNRNVKQIEVVEDLSEIPAAAKWGAKRVEQLGDMLPIRDAFKRQVELESQDAPADRIEANRKKLRAAYDAFKAKHGPLHQPRIRAIADGMPDGGLILAVEDVTSKVGARTLTVEDAGILSKRVFVPPSRRDRAESMDDAISMSLSETGGLDLERIGELMGMSEADVTAALSEGDAPRGFFDPEQGKWVTADEYLSGEVRRKLAAAEARNLEGNVAALNGVAPEPWGPAEITPSLGANWIPRQVYADFLKHLGYSNAVVKYQALTNTYFVETGGRPAAQWDTTNARAWKPDAIAAAVMNSSSIKITYKDSDDKTQVDEEATSESQQKAEEISVEFQDWVFADDGRRDELVNIFNAKFNTRITRQRDGSHLQLPGKNPAIIMRRHQNNAIWRGITDRVVLYDHVVGAGKTFTAIARAMERRRMGLSRKPMIVVPNHLTEQWAKDWMTLYPGAKLLVAGKKDFEKVNRRRLFARIAAGDYDGVIIGHSQITAIAIDPAVETGYLEQELRDALKAVKEAEDQATEDGTDQGWRKPMGVAEAERLVTKLEERLAKVRARKRDQLITFQQMGVDDLTIDEAHEFKNLAYSSRLTGVSGMGNKIGSQKAIDLHLKLRSLHDGNGAIAFLTGTPISNSVSEMYLLLRNLAPNQLREMGLENFDAWRTMFVTATTEWEPTEAGGLKEVTRLGREWTNMRTLMDLYYSVSDAVTLDDIKTAYSEDNDGAPFPVPRVKNADEGENRRMVAVKPGPSQTRILDDVVRGFDSLPYISNPKERNAERLRLMDKARKVALDARAVEPALDGDPEGGKIAAVVGEISRIYREWDSRKGTQIVFLDRSVPKGKGDEKVVAEYDAVLKAYDDAVKANDDAKIAAAVEKLDKFDKNDIDARRAALAGGWNAYDEIKDQLVAQGIPADQIRFVQEADTEIKKKVLFEKVRSGEVRVLLGSTPRMGAGTNVQDRLVALHHVDVTWKPSDIEQREGRIIRQGNKHLTDLGIDNFEAEVIAYATERTVDAKMWDLNGQKLRAINGIRKYDGRFLMEFEDAESASMAEMAALATGNPLMVERIKLDGERKKMMSRQRTFNKRRNAIRSELADAKRTIEKADDNAAFYTRLADTLTEKREAIEARSAKRSVTLDGTAYTDREAAETAIAAEVERQRDGKERGRFKIDLNGLPVTSQDDVQKILRSSFGEPDFEAEVGGETFIDAVGAGRALVAALNTALAEQESLDTKTLSGPTFMGMPIEVSVYPSYGADMGATVSILFEGEDAWTNTYYSKTGAITSGEFAATLRKAHTRMTAQDARMNAEIIKRKKAAAQKRMPELEAEAKKEWPEAKAFDEVNAKLDDVVKRLSDAAPAAETVSETDAGETRQKRKPVLPEQRSDGQPTREAMRDLKLALDAEIARLGLTGKVSASAWRSIADGPMALEGFYRAGEIGISASDGTPIETLHHEIIHALRDPALFGGPRGVFTVDEWRRLVRAARGDRAIMRKVLAEYPDQPVSVQTEEAVAELFRGWMKRRDAGPVSALLQRISDVLEAIGNVLRGQGFEAAGDVFRKIANGEMGGRGPDGPGGDQPRNPDGTFMAKRAALPSPQDARRFAVEARSMATGLDRIVSDAVTNAMKDRGGYNALALVPGRALFKELGRKIPAAQAYLALKEKMDTKRNDKHSETDETAQKWRRLMNRDKQANAELMKLMHDATIAGVDPAERFAPPDPRLDRVIEEGRKRNAVAFDKALEDKARYEQRQQAYDDLAPRFAALPKEFRDLYREVRDSYRTLDREQTDAIIGQVNRAMEIAEAKARREHEKATEKADRRYRAKLMAIDADKSMTGTERATARAQAKMERDEKVAESAAALERASAARKRTSGDHVRSMRARFETNRLEGPYFPLSRYGEYFVLARNELGDVVSFSRHQTVQEQRAEQKDREADGYEVQVGVMSETDTRDLVDPSFVADIQGMLSEATADEKLLDDIWQRWLETLPDMSIRKHRIHRKNRQGYDADALKAFGHHMFHGSHQLARLIYSLDMQEQLDLAQEQAAASDDPVRNGFIVNEMSRRHDFTMNPKGAWWASKATSLAFIYYLSVSPAAAIVNLSQTSIVGTAVLGRHGGTKKAAGALSKALADFTRSPRWHTEQNDKNLTAAERAAMNEAYTRGVIDRTQAHDLAQVAESGVAYDARWVNVMNKISWLFHHSERMNREVTFLAGYRLLREKGVPHDEAITQAGDMTWEVHFDYQNTSKPRIMQSPHMQVLLTFRNFSVNFLWRIFRDLHQAVKGEDAETRREARRQAAAMASMMLFHAGIKGMYGYGIVMALMGMFFGDDEDDPEERLEKFLFDYLPRPMVKAMLDGVPGTLAGVDLTSRIGMPNLWFRPPLRPLEGADLYQHYVNEVLGPIPGIGMNIATGAHRVIEGADLQDGSLIWRGVETAMPKWWRDLMKGGRFAYQGALTYNGDVIMDDFSAWEIFAQMSGFTPKELADRYDQNGRLKNKETAIRERRSNVIKQIAETIRDGGELSERQLRLVQEFNADYPEWPITMSTIKGSVRGRIQRSERNEGGVQVNPRLDPRLRGSLSPLVDPE